jgi:hypothetical protein
MPFYRRCDGAHCPLIDGLPPIRIGEVDLVPLTKLTGDQLQHFCMFISLHALEFQILVEGAPFLLS